MAIKDMTPDRWERIQKGYFGAIALGEVERVSYLDEICGPDTELRAEIDALLDCENKIGTFLESTAIDALTAAYHKQIIDDTEAVDTSETPDGFIGRVIDERYLVTDFVGSGGMGSVYRADHRLLATPVAIKRLAPHFRDHFEHRVRFIEEARRAVMLDHENVARVLDVVEEFNEVLVVMEFIDGTTLRDSAVAASDIDEFLHIATQCGSALVTAHSKGIVHLDLKPENIMLTTVGKVKICDFGMARELKTGEETRKWIFGGTPAYMAPEVLRSDNFDGRADVFSLGVIFYELLSSRHPFRSGNVQETTNRLMHEAVPSLTANKKVPGRLARLVDRMLEKDPGNRPPASEVLRSLESISRSRRYLSRLWSDSGEIFTQIPKSLIAASLVLVMLSAAAGMVYFETIKSAFGWPALPSEKVVVVLPFEVIGELPEERRFYSEGLWEMLTVRLMQLTSVPGLIVRSPSDILAPIDADGNKIDSVEEAQGELDATIVVKGVFQFFGNNARYTYHVIRTADQRNLRQGSHTLPFADPLVLQDSVTEDIAAALEIALAPAPGWGTENPEAFKLYTEGRGAVRENVDAGIDRFQRAVKTDSSYAAGYAALGLAHWQKYDGAKEQPAILEEASKACERAHQLDPRLSDAQVCLGRIHESKGDYELAVDFYRRATQYSAASEEAYRGLGSALGNLNKFEEAEKAYLRAIELAPPGDWIPHSWIASFYNSRSDFVNAIKHYSAAISLSKDNGKLYYSIANAYVNNGNYELAIASLKQSIEKRPYAAPPYSNLGLTYLRWRKYNEAIEPFEEAMARAPDDYRIIGNAARIYRLTGQVEKARDLYERAIEQALKELNTNRRPPDVFILMGRYYAMIGKKLEAVSAIRQALLARPNDPHFSLIAATAFTVLGDRNKALELTERAVELGYTSNQILAEPELDALASEPRYAKLMGSSDGLH